MKLETELRGVVGAQGLLEERLAEAPIVAPASEEEARALLHLARTQELRVKLLGLGSKLSWSAAAQGIDFALSTRRLRGIVEFVPGDGTITAFAGTPMSELREAAQAGGLELSPDVPRPERATLGGVLAAGASGPDRTRHGPSRLHVLGMRTLLASGEITKSGGRLVKNVTGYDLHRLYCGSHGTLALILEASLRLAPAPELRRLLRYTCDDLASGLALAHKIASVRVKPRCLTLMGSQGVTWSVELELAGRPAALDLELERLAALRSPSEVFEGAAAIERSRQIRDFEPDASTQLVLHLSSRPSQLRASCDKLFNALGSLEHGRVVVQPTLATLDMQLRSEGAVTEGVQAAREALAPLGSRLVLRGPGSQHGPPDISGAELTLVRRLRDTYDPGGLFAGLPIGR